MASLAPLVSSALLSEGIGFIKNEMSRQGNRVARNDALDQLKQRQSLQQQQAAADAALSRQNIALNAENSEEERKKALRRAVSRQRANFGAQGISSGGGSAQAVLLGLFEESDAEKKKREQLDALRLNAIDQDLGQKNSLNVLQRTQLKERNKLSTITGYGDTFGDLLSAGSNVYEASTRGN